MLNDIDYKKTLRILSAWGVIGSLVSLMVKNTEAHFFELTPDMIKEEFSGNHLMHGLHSYFPSFFMPGNETSDAFCMLRPPYELCNHLFWFLQDFSHPGLSTAAKRVCGEYVQGIFDILIDTGASYIDLIRHNDWYYPDRVIPFNRSTAHAFDSPLGTVMLCSNRHAYPDWTSLYSIMSQVDKLEQSFMNQTDKPEQSFMSFSFFMKSMITLTVMAVLTIALLNRNRIFQALPNFSFLARSKKSAQTSEKTIDVIPAPQPS